MLRLSLSGYRPDVVELQMDDEPTCTCGSSSGHCEARGRAASGVTFQALAGRL
jgi:hypothetical protein